MSFAGKLRDTRRRIQLFFGHIPQWVYAVLLALGVGTAGYFLGHGKPANAAGSKSASSAPSPQPPPAPSGPPSITLDPQQLQYAQLQLGRAVRTTLPTPLSAVGTVAPNINGLAQVAPRLAGKVVRVLVNVGQSVHAGQTLAIVSSPDLFQAQAQYQDAILKRTAAGVTLSRQLQLGRLGVYGRPALETARVNAAQTQGEVTNDQAAVVSSQAQVAQADVQVNLTQKTLARAQLLYQAQLVSRQELQQREADAQAASAALEAAKAALAASVDRLRNARNRASITERALARQTQLYQSGALTSEQIDPVRSAYLLASHEVEAAKAQLRLLGGPLVDESSPTGGLLPVLAPISGQVSARMVSAGELATTDKPILTLINLRMVIVQLNVYQEDAAHLRTSLPVVVVSNAAPGHNYRGVISVVGTAVDPNTRTVPVYCAIRNIGMALRPGVYIAGSISGAARSGVVAVPSAAVQISQNGHVVFTPGTKAGEYVAQPVQVGETVSGLTQITQGLMPGQPIVTTNAFLLKAQMIKDTLD